MGEINGSQQNNGRTKTFNPELYLSGDFQPGVPEVFSDSVVPTVSTLG